MKFKDWHAVIPWQLPRLILANLSMMVIPCLAGFPPRLALWQELAGQSLTISFWVFLGMLGLLIAAIRTLAVFVMAEENKAWALNESWVQMTMLGVGVIGLIHPGDVPANITAVSYQPACLVQSSRSVNSFCGRAIISSNNFIIIIGEQYGIRTNRQATRMAG